MVKRTVIAAILSLGAVVAVTTPAQAGNIMVALPGYYDSPNGYDFVNTLPPAGSTTIGTFDFSIPAGTAITGITISGTFGNPDVGTTALSDYYLGFNGNETAVDVANCDSIFSDCYSGQNGPTGWSYQVTGSNLSTLASAIDSGSLDFTYTWDNNTIVQIPNYYQYVYAGAATIDIETAPEPAALLMCLGGLLGIAAIRRFRRV